MQIIKTAVNKYGDRLELFRHFGSIGIEMKKSNGCGFCTYPETEEKAFIKFNEVVNNYKMTAL